MSIPSPQTTILVCHGAWGGGWSWKKMHPLMQAAGFRLVTPTYTGLGERAHLANPAIDLETHIQDILNVITYEDLGNIALLGHSYGGMVATAVADRARDRVAQLIYLDAFVPRDGQSLFDLNEAGRRPMREAAASGDGWRVPPNPTPPDTSAADLEWLTPRRADMPIKCFETKLRLYNGEPAMPQMMLALPSKMFTDHLGSPVAPFRQTRMPVAPREKTSPLEIVGVARGPSPPSLSEK